MLKCSICNETIPDPCQAHYLDGPVCVRCLIEEFTKPLDAYGTELDGKGKIDTKLKRVDKFPSDDSELLWSNIGEW